MTTRTPVSNESRLPASRSRGALAAGAGFGLVAGAVFAMMEVLGAIIMGNPALMPLRMFASTLLGQDALTASALGMVMVVGLLAHFALSAIFGMIYSAIESSMSPEGRTSWGRQAVVGLLFGLGLWLVNFQIIARIFYPWFLGTPQFLQAMMHALFFGLPLGLMFAALERRRRPLGAASRAGPVHA